MNRTRVVRAVIGAVSRAVEPLAMAVQRRRDAGAVLLYHRIAPGNDSVYPSLSPEHFERHCQFVSKHLTVIPLGELVERRRRGASLRGCCAITFDDGYRDFLEFAHPTLRKYRLSATHFLVNRCLETGLPPWTYRARRLELAGARTPKLGGMSMTEREAWLEERERLTPGLAPLPVMLCAEDLAKVDASLVEWGSHSRSHAFLDSVARSELRAEILESKGALEALTGRPARFFAYPNGHHSDAAQRMALDAGFEAAFAVGHGLVGSGTPIFAVPRIDMGTYPPSMLALEITGAVQMVRDLRRPSAS